MGIASFGGGLWVAAKDEDTAFVEEWRGFVTAIAQRLRGQLDLPVELEELVALGFEGLLGARRRFDPDRGVKFTTFAHYRVRGAMIDGVRKMTYLSPKVEARRRAAEAADATLEDRAEVAAGARAAGAPSGGATGALQALEGALSQVVTGFVLSSAMSPELAEGVDPAASPEERLVDESEAAELRRAVATLPDRERALVAGFYFDGRRFDEIAAELGISKSWASRLHHKAMGRLREMLDDE